MSHELLVVVGGDEDTVMDLLLEDDDPPFDGYVLGGRWSGWLRLRPGASGRLGERGVGDDRPDDDPSLAGRADCAVLGDVDVEGMRAEAERAAGEHGDRWRRAVDGLPPDRSFPEVAAQVEAEAEAEARRQRRGLLRRPAPPPTGEELRRRTLAAHAAQPRQAALRAVLDLERVVLPDQASPDDLPREDHVELARLSALTGAHLLRDGVRHERPYVELDGAQAVLAWLREHGRWPDEVGPDTVVAAVAVHR